jgi:2,3-dihydroxyphenylpropionate 1,2-dioxygenase
VGDIISERWAGPSRNNGGTIPETLGSASFGGWAGRVGDYARGPGSKASARALPGRKFHSQIPSAISFELVRQLYRQNFDPAFTSTARIDYAIGIPLTYLGVCDPVLPIYVNAYLPPQPTMERCYAFGEAVPRTVTAMGLKTAILASGGMSHFPGTDRYARPDLAWDNKVLEKLAAGNLKSLIGYDEAELDATMLKLAHCWMQLGTRSKDILDHVKRQVTALLSVAATPQDHHIG